MSEPANPAPTARPRPGTVTNASYLLYLAAALIAVLAAVSFATVGTVSTVYREAYAGSDLEGADGFIVGTTVVSAVLQLLVAIALVVLALLNNQGRNGARIATWVVAGLGVCCTGLGAGGSAFSGMGAGGGSTGDVPDPAEVQRRLEAELPSWSGPLTLICSIVALLALIAAIILLALPASNEFFRKQPAGVDPALPGAAYPGQPTGEPGYPQYPPAGQQPGAGTDPGYPPSGQPPSNPPGNPPTPPNPPSS
ncbi:hypothetical protein O7626_33540 [Micromonospora sp. WMMD1102]|uniref:hypothetical protein n=1 Tax=Micromonospora sp. WMMD1102 TaxID=3016105 RepID=UPI002414F10E|nr:hypothetical protein [Micromonospora sp. WMMD1102]MDG4790776.1 hypothetical protein [Micromonospora sp. WMMD1102]